MCQLLTETVGVKDDIKKFGYLFQNTNNLNVKNVTAQVYMVSLSVFKIGFLMKVKVTISPF